MQCKYIHESHQFGKTNKQTKNKNKIKKLLDFSWKNYFHVI